MCNMRTNLSNATQKDFDEHKAKLLEQIRAGSRSLSTIARPKGPGDYLHDAILQWVGEGPTRECGCEDRIAALNRMTPSECREQLDMIAGWLYDEAIRRGWWQAKLPGAKWAIRRLILSAIG